MWATTRSQEPTRVLLIASTRCVLASGRSVRVTAGHNLFTLHPDGQVRKVRTSELAAGVQIAVPRRIPEPPSPTDSLWLLDVVPEAERSRLTISGPTARRWFRTHGDHLAALLREAGYAAVGYYRQRGRLPWTVAAQVPGLLDELRPDDRIGRRGERHTLPAALTIDADLAWLLGMYVAEGHRRRQPGDHLQHRPASTRSAAGDVRPARAPRLPVERCGRVLLQPAERPARVAGDGWPRPVQARPAGGVRLVRWVLRSFLDGIVDGDGSISENRTSVWTTSEDLVADLLLVFARLEQRAASTSKATGHLRLWQVYAPHREHKLLTSVPLPDAFLPSSSSGGWSQPGGGGSRRRVRTCERPQQPRAALRS